MYNQRNKRGSQTDNRSAHSTEETANHSGEKGHTLYGCKELLRGQESQLVQCSKLKYRVKPYALIGHVRFE